VESLGLRRIAQEVIDPSQHGAQHEGLAVHAQLPGLDPGEVENVVDEMQQGIAGLADAQGHFTLIGRQGAVLQDLRETQDGVHRGPHLMAHVRQELALGGAGGGELGGALLDPHFQGGVEVADGLLGLLTLRDIAHHAPHIFGVARRIPVDASQSQPP